MSIYTYISFSAARQQLANRLYDSSKIFWTNAELGLYLADALRTWNALTGYWRDDFTFQSQPSVPWYDFTDTTNLPNTLRPLTLHDTDLYTQLQYHLLEPVAWNPWAGASVQFTADDLLNAVSRRRDEILSTCGCTITRRAVPAMNGRTILPDTVIDVRRIAYLPTAIVGKGYGIGRYGHGPYGFGAYGTAGGATVLFSDDTWSEQSFNRQYTRTPAGVPQAFLLSAQPPISFDTDIPPGGAGSYELLTVEAGPALSISAPTTLSLPDDWTHLIKWGALADLLSRDSNAKDPARAAYCETRYQMGLKLLRDAPVLLAMRVNNIPLQIDSVRGGDLYRTHWQGEPHAQPDLALHAGLNMIALANIPDQAYSMTATVVENAPIPVADTDPVQVAREDLDALLDYAVHIALFKSGGAEFASTAPLMQRFVTQATLYNSKLAELGEYTSALFGLSKREERDNPRLAPAAVSATALEEALGSGI